MLSDLRFALRQLRRAPGFAVLAVLTLALGIGANATAFSLVNALLLRPAPHVRAPERLVALYTSDHSGPAHGTSSLPDLEDFAEAGRREGVFDGVGGFAPRPATFGDGDARERGLVELVTADYLRVLGVQPQRGRAFTADEARGAGAPVVMISDGLWERRFGRAPGAVGATLVVNAVPATVVGVLPPRFGGGLRLIAADAWVPIRGGAALGLGGRVERRGNRGMFAVARLAPGATVGRAQGAMNLLAARMRGAYPDQWIDVRDEGRRVTLLEERLARVPPQMRGPALAFSALLGATVVLVLLVCCANVAGLLLARATARTREVALRLSLGATRERIVRQLLVESALLAAIAAALGLLATRWVTAALAHVDLPLPVAVTLDLAPDWRVLAFSAAVTTLAVAAFGLAPALRATRADVHAAIKAGAVPAGRTRLQSALVVGQLATSLVLAASALLFLRAVRAAAAIDPGFTARAMLLVDLERVPGAGGDSSSARVGAALSERVAGIPGVSAVSWADVAPLNPDVSRRGTRIEGHVSPPGEDTEFAFNVVGPGYFETLGLPLARGRGFTPADRAGAPEVIVVTEAFARRFWPADDAIGRRVSLDGGETWRTVVGVARDAKYKQMTERPREYVYTPALQEDGRGVTLHVRTGGDPRAVRGAVRAALREAAPGWTSTAERTLAEQVDASLLPQRVAGTVLAAFGLLSLLLGGVGVYGVMAYTVARRTREIGVRMALGARAVDVVRMVMRQSATLAAIGLVVGLPLAWGASRLLGGLLLGVGGDVVAPFLGAAAALAVAACAAAWVPARRAARVDANTALRWE